MEIVLRRTILLRYRGKPYMLLLVTSNLGLITKEVLF